MRLKSVMVSACTCDYIVFTNNEFLNCSVWAVGTTKHLVVLVVSFCTKFEDTWSGKVNNMTLMLSVVPSCMTL